MFKSPGAVEIAANGSLTISFTPKYEDPLWVRQDDVNTEKEFAIQVRTSSRDYDIPGQPLLENTVVSWTADIFIETETTPDTEEKISSSTLLFGGIGVGVLVLAMIGFVLYRRASADFEDASFYEEQDIVVEDEPVELPEGKPLDDFEDKTISEEPELIERPSDSLISEVDDVEEEAIEEASEVDDGISTDEYGTEWYEDEVGTWWYREAGAEDWSEYNE